jgi:Fic family protein
MDELHARITAKKAELDKLRPRLRAGLGNFEHVHDIELTYTSNAIEGNTLTAAETTLVIEQRITIGVSRSGITSKRSITMTRSAMCACWHAGKPH